MRCNVLVLEQMVYHIISRQFIGIATITVSYSFAQTLLLTPLIPPPPPFRLPFLAERIRLTRATSIIT
jgi:hypothetical protein